MDVLKARDTFYHWANICLKQYLSGLTEQQQVAIRLIPLIFQTNHRMLPAYVGANTPTGIYGYRPDKQLLAEARKINHRFAYDQQTVLKNTIIDALYLQLGVLDQKVTLILIHKAEIDVEQNQQLQVKMSRLVRWLESEQLYVTGVVQTAEQLVSSFLDKSVTRQHFGLLSIDNFYFESILLAGKYPLWWLIPPENDLNYRKIVQQIEHARYVNDNEYLDFGPASEFNINMILYSVMNLMRQGIADDSILLRYCMTWQSLRMHSNGLLSAALKSELIETKQDLQLLSTSRIYTMTIGKLVNALFGQEEWEKISRIYHLLIPFSNYEIKALLSELPEHSEGKQSPSTSAENNLAIFIDAKKRLQGFVTAAAARVVEQITNLDVGEDDIELFTQLLELYQLQLNSPDLLAVINQQSIPAIIQEKILIRELIQEGEASQWGLVIKDEQGNEYLVHRLTSLLALIAWAWLNRIIDQNTQMSIDCPGHQVKQIEARYALEVLVHQLSNDFWQYLKQSQTDDRDWVSKSLVFVRFISMVDDESLIEGKTQYQNNVSRQVLLYEQLIVNRWGDVHYRLFYGDAGVVHCLCDWLNNVDLNDEFTRNNFNIYSYSSGEVNYYVQQLTQIYSEMMDFFAEHNDLSASYILRLGINYYVISQQQGEYNYQKITAELALYQFLEKTAESFKPVILQKTVLTDTPLTMFYQKNSLDVVQFCFQKGHEQYDIWVLDERGSLCHCRQSIVGFEKLVSHWLLFIRNIVSQYQKAAVTVPGFELFYSESDGSGGFRLSKVNTDGINVHLNEPSVSVKCQDLAKGNELSVQIGDTLFDYLEHGDDVIKQCVDYFNRAGQKTDYLVTDVEVSIVSPGSMAAKEMQFVHFLKLKRRIEFELGQ